MYLVFWQQQQQQGLIICYIPFDSFTHTLTHSLQTMELTNIRIVIISIECVHWDSTRQIMLFHFDILSFYLNLFVFVFCISCYYKVMRAIFDSLSINQSSPGCKCTNAIWSQSENKYVHIQQCDWVEGKAVPKGRYLCGRIKKNIKQKYL